MLWRRGSRIQIFTKPSSRLSMNTMALGWQKKTWSTRSLERSAATCMASKFLVKIDVSCHWYVWTCQVAVFWFGLVVNSAVTGMFELAKWLCSDSVCLNLCSLYKAQQGWSVRWSVVQAWAAPPQVSLRRFRQVQSMFGSTWFVLVQCGSVFLRDSWSPHHFRKILSLAFMSKLAAPWQLCRIKLCWTLAGIWEALRQKTFVGFGIAFAPWTRTSRNCSLIAAWLWSVWCFDLGCNSTFPFPNPLLAMSAKWGSTYST